MPVAPALARFALTGRARDRRDGLDRPQLLQVSREVRLRSRQAARLFGDRARGGDGAARRRLSVESPVGRRRGRAGAARAPRVSASIGDLQTIDEAEAIARIGEDGRRLWRLAHGIDERKVSPERETKSISAETTFDDDIGDRAELERMLLGLCEKVARRLKAAELATGGVTLKLRLPDFKLRTRARALPPTQLAPRLFEAARALLAAQPAGRALPADRRRRLGPAPGRRGRRRRSRRGRPARERRRARRRSTLCATNSGAARWCAGWRSRRTAGREIAGAAQCRSIS